MLLWIKGIVLPSLALYINGHDSGISMSSVCIQGIFYYTRHLLFIRDALSSSTEDSDQNNPEYSHLNQYHCEPLLSQDDCFPDTVKV